MFSGVSRDNRRLRAAQANEPWRRTVPRLQTQKSPGALQGRGEGAVGLTGAEGSDRQHDLVAATAQVWQPFGVAGLAHGRMTLNGEGRCRAHLNNSEVVEGVDLHTLAKGAGGGRGGSGIGSGNDNGVQAIGAALVRFSGVQQEGSHD